MDSYFFIRKQLADAPPKETRKELFKTTKHWKTVYDYCNSAVLNGKITRSQRVEWSLPRSAYNCPRGTYTTENESNFGQYGSRPRDRLGPQNTAIPVNKSEHMYEDSIFLIN